MFYILLSVLDVSETFHKKKKGHFYVASMMRNIKTLSTTLKNEYVMVRWTKSSKILPLTSVVKTEHLTFRAKASSRMLT